MLRLFALRTRISRRCTSAVVVVAPFSFSLQIQRGFSTRRKGPPPGSPVLRRNRRRNRPTPASLAHIDRRLAGMKREMLDAVALAALADAQEEAAATSQQRPPHSLDDDIIDDGRPLTLEEEISREFQGGEYDPAVAAAWEHCFPEDSAPMPEIGPDGVYILTDEHRAEIKRFSEFVDSQYDSEEDEKLEAILEQAMNHGHGDLSMSSSPNVREIVSVNDELPLDLQRKHHRMGREILSIVTRVVLTQNLRKPRHMVKLTECNFEFTSVDIKRNSEAVVISWHCAPSEKQRKSIGGPAAMTYEDVVQSILVRAIPAIRYQMGTDLNKRYVARLQFQYDASRELGMSDVADRKPIYTLPEHELSRRQKGVRGVSQDYEHSTSRRSRRQNLQASQSVSKGDVNAIRSLFSDKGAVSSAVKQEFETLEGRRKRVWAKRDYENRRAKLPIATRPLKLLSGGSLMGERSKKSVE